MKANDTEVCLVCECEKPAGSTCNTATCPNIDANYETLSIIRQGDFPPMTISNVPWSPSDFH